MDNACKESEEEVLEPRDYQIQLMKIALKQNTIIYLPTGSGKTFIAIMLLKALSEPLKRPLNEGGKISMFLVSTVALVYQHSETLRRHTPFKIGSFTGEMNVDNWSEDRWRMEISAYQVFVMTVQIALNIVRSGYLQLKSINLMIFDECHHAVNDEPMRQLMRLFEHVKETPRVLGLTATLLNGNVKPDKVLEEVKALEATFQSKVAAIDELRHIAGYSTNPTEILRSFDKLSPTELTVKILDILNNVHDVVENIDKQQKQRSILGKTLKPLDIQKGYKEYLNIVKDVVKHIEMLGLYGGQISALAHTIQLERLKRHCEDQKEVEVVDAIITPLTVIRKILKNEMENVSIKDAILKFSSPQLLKLLDIFREYKKRTNEPLMGLIFTERRFTAKILYHVFTKAAEVFNEFKGYSAEFIIGFSNNPNVMSREGMFSAKMNKKAHQKFINKEVNILFSTNVLEEGIDVPTCTLVIRFDAPKDYRSYIQSKGRARHRNSFYYIMVNNTEETKYLNKYLSFQKVEKKLLEYLVGSNEFREGPSKSDIEEKYRENILPPYYVNGPGSAQIDMLNAISKLCQYCQSLPSDIYTEFVPEWYLEEVEKKCRVIIEMPIVSPLIEPIEGPWMTTRKDAKRAAAYVTCITLHKMKELDDNLQPKKQTLLEEDTNFLFRHWLQQKEKLVGYRQNNKAYKKQVPSLLRSSLIKNNVYYLHLIQLQPTFLPDPIDACQLKIHELYRSNLCYGIITTRALPKLCKFSVYVTLGQIDVDIITNVKTVSLTHSELMDVRCFNYIIYHDILRFLKDFLIFDNDSNSCQFLVVPVDKKEEMKVRLDILADNKELIDYTQEPNVQERMALVVNDETYLGKIVIPWYRGDHKQYIVGEVCQDMNANSEFPSRDFKTFASYFDEKYRIRIFNPNVPLLFVKALTKNLQCLKPKSSKGKRSREKTYEETKEHMIPELCIKQNFPGELWVQAILLPSILHRCEQLIRAEELRSRIAVEANLGIKSLDKNDNWKPLVLDIHQLVEENESEVNEKQNPQTEEPIESIVSIMSKDLQNVNRDVNSKMLDKEFPWSGNEEPIDIDRNLSVTLMEIQHYDNFISQPVTEVELKKPSLPTIKAITYKVTYNYKAIKMINNPGNPKGPEIRDIYKTLCTMKCNEIVNLERLETLGDSFLKMSISMYVFLRFPSYTEGKATTLKGKIVSNRNLYYVGIEKGLHSCLKMSDFSPQYDWLPPGLCTPNLISDDQSLTGLDLSFLMHLQIPKNEVIAGVLSENTQQLIVSNMSSRLNNEDGSNQKTAELFYPYLNVTVVPDKTVADCVEALLGAYFESNGLQGALKMLEWFKIIPESENITEIFSVKPQNPLLRDDATPEKIDRHIPMWKMIEDSLQYHFSNRAYLLQALTHSSYTPNRLTNCYQRLEFLGDAVLDFLITCHIFEVCERLDPGQLTDLRSALVNNITFAGISVRLGLHKFLLFSNQQLQRYIDNFVKHQEEKEFIIDEQVLILLEENDTGMYLSEHIDVPKVLGDVFEALVGAIFLDCGMNLETVWKIVHKIMYQELESFCKKIPRNAVRLLYETPSSHPEFYKAVKLQDGETCMVRLDFMANGEKKTVYGFGENKVLAKKAAAKFALRLI